MINDQIIGKTFQEEVCIPLKEHLIRMRALRLILLLELFLLIVLFLEFREVYVELMSGHLLGISASVLLLFGLTSNLYLKAKVFAKIVFHEDCIEISKNYFWVKTILKDSICSFEELKYKNKILGTLIGQKNGKILSFDPKLFRSDEDYICFKQRIEDILEDNKECLSEKAIEVKPITLAQNVLLLTVIGLWIAIYIGLLQESPTEFYAALDLGALTKNVQFGEELYRVPSSFFLHLNTVHIAANVLAFSILGQFMLRLVDPFRFLNILLGTALLSAMATLFLSPFEAVIGASGGIVGVFGAYCCVKLLRNLPGSISASSNFLILLSIALQIGLGFIIEGIDSYTHAAGFVAGSVYMWGCLRDKETHSIYASTSLEKTSACVLCAIYLGGLFVFVSQLYMAV